MERQDTRTGHLEGQLIVRGCLDGSVHCLIYLRPGGMHAVVFE
jgi:hypothetical protein